MHKLSADTAHANRKNADFLLRLDTSKLVAVRERMPAGDFSDGDFDIDRGVPTTDALVILSTPRSGSTLLCDLIRRSEACLPHEYFHGDVYMPLLGARWGCLREDRLDVPAYVRALRRYRTYPNGWLGINLHGEHLVAFLSARAELGDVNLHYVHLLRKDLVAQAVSFEIAYQSGRWTKQFPGRREPRYSYAAVREKLQAIQAQNAAIRAFVVKEGAHAQTVWYEDLVADPSAVLRGLPCVEDEIAAGASGLSRQGDERNRDWSERFAAEYLGKLEERGVNGTSPELGTARRIGSTLLRRVAHWVETGR